MTCNSGDVVMVPFPYVDVDHAKIRPALIISPHRFNLENHQYWFLMITTAKKSGWSDDYDLLYWQEAGLKLPCRVRMKAATMSAELVYKPIGKLHPDDWQQIKMNLTNFFAELN